MTVFMVATIIINWSTGMLFSYDVTGIYVHGKLYNLMYIYALTYFVIVGIISIIHRDELSSKEFRCIWEYLIIITIAVIVQFVTGKLLTIGVGIGLGLAAFYITISNPYSHIDSITGMPDKTALIRWIRERKAVGGVINIIAVDLYKQDWLVQAYGSETADGLVLIFVDRLSAIAGKYRVFSINTSRYVIETSDRNAYEEVKKKLVKLFDTPVQVNGTTTYLPATIIGIKNAGQFKSINTLFQYAEYLFALSSHGEETEVFEDNKSNREGFCRNIEIEKFVEEAIEKELFQVYYQPVYSVKEKKFVSLEVLSRLAHPEMGEIAPDQFISIAESRGAVDRISLMQLRRVCDFMVRNGDRLSDIETVKINLSPQELLKEGHEMRIMQIIKDSGLAPDNFSFEITETVATEYTEHVKLAIEKFRNAGIGLCLDDFGSGYANLNTVLKIPFDTIKIDRSLLSGIFEDENVAQFYEKIVNILQGMGYNIVSEGVETEEEFRLLASWNVDMLQGYYFSRPVPDNLLLDVVTAQGGIRNEKS